MKRLTSILLAILMCTAVLCACGDKNGATPDEAGTIQPTTKLVLTELETPYAKLRVPDYFKDNVKTEVAKKEPYTLKFSAKDGTELFTLIFGGKGKTLLGTIINNGEYTVLYADIPTIDAKNEHYAEYSEYQECLGNITENLKKDYDFVPNMIEEPEDTSTYDIKTSVCTLKYPKKWQKKVKTNESGDTVQFTCDGVKLFDICFSEKADGIKIGKYKDKPVYAVTYTFDKEKNKDNLEQLRAMQDDVNVIIDNLALDKNFSK